LFDRGRRAHSSGILLTAREDAVAASFFTKTGHQIGAVWVGQFSGIEIVVLVEASELPGLGMTFLRYDAERERWHDRELVGRLSTLAADGVRWHPERAAAEPRSLDAIG
jgi:hypothetical protein